MPSPAIAVENLGKAYRLGLKEEIPDSLIGAATSWIRSPLSNFHRLRRLNTFNTRSDAEEDDVLWALRDVNFDVNEGEVVGIIGRNGAGKSTLLKILSRITSPTHGRAVIRGRVSSLLEVGTGFHPELSGRENVYMNGTILGMRKKEIDRKFDEIVDFSGVEKFLDTPVKRYSSGMKVRLAFAVAAHLEPEILIIDEVLAVGDAAFQKKCLGKMQNVAEGGRTVLFVSHNMAAVESLSGRGILLNAGTVVLTGDISDVIRRYRAIQPLGENDGVYLSSDGGPAGECAIVYAAAHSGDRFSSTGYAAGETLKFVVECTGADTIRDPQLGIGIDTIEGQRLVTLHSNLIDGCPGGNSLDSRVKWECTAKHLLLSPGEYYVVISLEDGSRPVERLSPAFRLTIHPSDAYRNGGKIGRGLVLCDQIWSRANSETSSKQL